MKSLAPYWAGLLSVQSEQPRLSKFFKAIACLCLVKNLLAVFCIVFCCRRPTFFAFTSIVYLFCIPRKSHLKNILFWLSLAYLNGHSWAVFQAILLSYEMFETQLNTETKKTKNLKISQLHPKLYPIKDRK